MNYTMPFNARASAKLVRYIHDAPRTAAWEARVICEKFYPWRVEQAREIMREEALVKKAQAGR